MMPCILMCNIANDFPVVKLKMEKKRFFPFCTGPLRENPPPGRGLRGGIRTWGFCGPEVQNSFAVFGFISEVCSDSSEE